MAGIVSRLPFPLSGRTSSAAASATANDVAYDYAIGGMMFLAGTADDKPYTRSLSPLRKPQFDNTREPGEQSLADWWLRSQSTFIGGGGLLYQDPDLVQVANLQNKHAIQYGSSVGLNPWTNGQLTMLRQTGQRIADASANSHLLLGWNDGTDRYWSAVGNVLKSDTGAAVTTITWGGANTIRALASDGTNYYAADNVQVYKGAGNGAGAAWSATATTNVALGFVKGRMMMALDNKVYELSSTGTQTLRFTHLNPGFTFTAFAEGTNAIYAAGSAGAQGSIYKFTIDTTGAIPVLASGGTVTAQLPLGETVLSMTSYLGTFIGLGTSRGFRVGQIDTNGDIVYGPILTPIAGGVKAIAAYDRFMFFGGSNAIDGSSGLYRVDLGQPISDSGSSAGLRFAFTTDLQAHAAGVVSAVTNFGTSDRMVFAVVGQGSYLEDATVLEPTGYLTTGRIRYNTLEPKLYKFVSVKTPASYAGALTISVIDPGGATTSIITLSEGTAIPAENVALAAPSRAVEWIQLRFDFARSTVSTATGMVMNGWQLKAMPGSVRQRVFEIPLLCFDKEKDKNGQWSGAEGRTLARIEAFEQIAQRGDGVAFQDLNLGLSYTVIIDDFKFEQKASPGPNGEGYGGYLYLQLRTIADVISA